jgi:quercetin dioxygenase-like cupin family protein
MSVWKNWTSAVAVLCAAVICRGEAARIVFTHGLPAQDGGRLEAEVVEVTYGPGEWSPAHSHPCAVVGYVIEGAVRMQVKGEPEATYKAGQCFYEAPNSVHAISANASKTKRARFLAYFTCDHESPLTVAAPESKAVEGK